MQLSLNQKAQYEDILNDLKKDGITGNGRRNTPTTM